MSWLMMLSLLLVPTLAQAEDSIRLVVGGVEVQTDVAPVIEGGRTLVPLRVVAESLGFEVTWDGLSQTATLVRGDTTIMLTVDRPDALVNGNLITLDVPPTIRFDRMLVPVRFAAEQIGLDVAWDEATRTVVITPTGSAAPSVAIDPEALRLLQQVREERSYRITGGFTTAVDAGIATLTTDVSIEGYLGGPDESLIYTTVQVAGVEQTVGVAVYQGQVWSKYEAGAWTARPLGVTLQSGLMIDPTALAYLRVEDLKGASFSLSQRAYEGTEMRVLTMDVDVAALAELLGEQAFQMDNGSLEVNYWFNADNSPHHMDFHLTAVPSGSDAGTVTLTGTLYWEPWDQAIPFPAEIVGQ